MPSRKRARAAWAAILVAVASAAACRDDEPERAQTALAREPAPPPPARLEGYAVQLSAYADSARAARLARALVDSGWAPVVHAAPSGGAARWRVYVGVSPAARALPDLIAAGIRVAGGEALVARDSFVTAQLADSAWVHAVSVNAGSVGMMARARWAMAPDSSALLVVEDPVGVAGDPVVDGFVYASEGLDCYVQADSVWDVAPSPTWDRLAYGRGVGVLGGTLAAPRDSVWPAIGARLGLPPDSARRASFAASARSYTRVLAQPVVLSLASAPLPDSTGASTPALARRALPMAGGWRVRWSPDGSALAVGANPTAARDDAPPRRWLAALPAPEPRALAPGTVREMARTTWVEGPTLDPSLPVELTRPGAGADGSRITNRGGWIRMTVPGGRSRIVGPGVALAATRGGRFVLALAPHPDAFRDAPTAQLVVYATAAGGAPAARPCRVADAPG